MKKNLLRSIIFILLPVLMAAGTIFIGVSGALTFFFLIVLAVVIFIVNAVYLRKAASIESEEKSYTGYLDLENSTIKEDKKTK